MMRMMKRSIFYDVILTNYYYYLMIVFARLSFYPSYYDDHDLMAFDDLYFDYYFFFSHCEILKRILIDVFLMMMMCSDFCFWIVFYFLKRSEMKFFVFDVSACLLKLKITYTLAISKFKT
jgi:hypothetical protein